MKKNLGLARSKIHTTYRDSKGRWLVGTTTALNVLAKPALIDWAWKLGLEGIDYKKIRDASGDIGTLTHDYALCHFKKRKPDTSEYSQKIIEMAEKCFQKFLDWEKHHTIEPIIMEEPLVSDEYRFGGTPDLYGIIDGVPTLLDFKTSNYIYRTHFLQLAGYRQLIKEKGYEVDNNIILRIGRNESEGFEAKKKKNLDFDFEMFSLIVKLYYMDKKHQKMYPFWSGK